MLTGNIRYRRAWTGKMILQVEYWSAPYGRWLPFTTPYQRTWRDANWRDVHSIDTGKITPEEPARKPTRPLWETTTTTEETPSEPQNTNLVDGLLKTIPSTLKKSKQ